MKRWIVTILLLALWLLPVAALAQSQDNTWLIPAGEHISGDVATMSQNIRVDGVVDGDVTSWSGAITIAGSVGGDVVSYGGAVTVTPTGRVAGHILASGGLPRLEAGAVVAGQVIDSGGGGALASLLDLLSPSATGAGDDAIGRTLLGATLAVLVAAISMLYLAFWPGRIALAGMTLRRLPGRSVALGLLTTLMLALALLPLAGLLLASVVGIPVLLALLALALALYVDGLVVLAGMFSAPLAAWSGRASGPGATKPIALALVLAIALVTTLAPLWGLALFYLAASPGLGALILSRGGMAAPVEGSL